MPTAPGMPTVCRPATSRAPTSGSRPTTTSSRNRFQGRTADVCSGWRSGSGSNKAGKAGRSDRPGGFPTWLPDYPTPLTGFGHHGPATHLPHLTRLTHLTFPTYLTYPAHLGLQSLLEPHFVPHRNPSEAVHFPARVLQHAAHDEIGEPVAAALIKVHRRQVVVRRRHHE